MPINGLPPWGSYPSIESMGGGVNKRNYMEAPVNPETDVDVGQYNLLCASVAASASTAAFAVLGVTLDTSPVVHSYRAQHGMGPPQAPTVSEDSTGVYTVQWASSYTDAFGQSQSISLVDMACQGHGASRLTVQPERVDARTWTVRVWDSSDTLVAGERVTITVYSGN